MAQRGAQRESVSCSCGHVYCLSCFKTNWSQQRFRYNSRRSEVECLISSQLEPGDVHPETTRDVTELATSLTVDHSHPSVSTDRAAPGQAQAPTSTRTSFVPVVSIDSNSLRPDFSSRKDFLQYKLDITLDPNTAFTDLTLSKGNRRVTNIGNEHNYPDHADRFTFFWQVLSRQRLTGRCYWEVDWIGSWVYVAVAYATIERKEDTKQSGFGGNDQSWALHCRKNLSAFWHNTESCLVPGPVGSRIGVYLDHDAGILSFYSVKDHAMTIVHRVQTTFTQPLLAGLWVAIGATAAFCKLK